MSTRSVADRLRTEYSLRTTQASRAADLLRSAADRLEAGDADETRNEQAARVRGAVVLALTASLDLAATSGWLEAFAVAEQNEVTP
jgi:hypothetical protein